MAFCPISDQQYNNYITSISSEQQNKANPKYKHNSIMTSWLNQTQFVHNIAQNLLQAKHTHYHEDYLKHKLIECNAFHCRTLWVTNKFGERIKMSLIRAPDPQEPQSAGSREEVSRETTHKQHNNSNNSNNSNVCIVYLHGFGSHRLEGITILSALGKEWGLCCFDFSGSGKSEGEISTYGLKQYLDIESVIDVLRDKFGYGKFVLWGRSMGATASLLYTSSPTVRHKQSILFQVLDSPFSSFESIAQHHANISYKLPEMFINFGLGILKEHFKTHEYNPFLIDLTQNVGQCRIPALFVYCENDTIIPARNSCDIVDKLNDKMIYQKLIIPENHNTFRSQDTLRKIIEIVGKYAHDNKAKEKIKYKRGIHEICSGPVTPTSTANSLSFITDKDKDKKDEKKSNERDHELGESEIKIKRLSGLNNYSKSKINRKQLIKQKFKLNPQNNGQVSYFFNSCGNCRKVQ